MELPKDGSLLRIFIGESDRHAGMLLYEWIVRTAREHGLAGATVLRGVEGFGARSRVRTAKILDLSTDLPIIVEIVDTAEKIEALLPAIDGAIGDGLATMERRADQILPEPIERDRWLSLPRVWLFRTPYDIELAKEKFRMEEGTKRLFVGLKVTKALQDDLANPAPGTKQYFEGHQRRIPADHQLRRR
jgi:PII-like signaling protein